MLLSKLRSNAELSYTHHLKRLDLLRSYNAIKHSCDRNFKTVAPNSLPTAALVTLRKLKHEAVLRLRAEPVKKNFHAMTLEPE